MYYDSHCHIYKEYYDDIPSLMQELEYNNIKFVINNGCDKNSNIEVIELISKYNFMYGAIGIHPEAVNSCTDADLKYIEDHLSDKKIIAIGEIGLDYHYGKEDKEKQIRLFEKQLKLAEKYNMPVIVHSRDATLDTINCLKKYKVKGIIHSFSGSYETASIYIKMGFLLGINGVITFKNANLKDVIKRIGLEHVTIETDSPYLAPHPYRGTKNSPKNVIVIVDFLADLFKTTAQEVENITSNNISKIFDI